MMQHHEMRQLIQQHKAQAAERFKDESRERLAKIGCKKIETTMIGSLDSIERHFGFLWGLDEHGQLTGTPLTDEQQHMKEVFEQLRLEILDRGNDQKRNFRVELDQYSIQWQRYHLQLPVKPQGPQG